jgi:hypothetical protein
MKKFLLALLISGSFITSPAFAQAYESSIDYGKKKQDAFVIDYAFSPEAAENAIVAKLEKLGYKPKEEKGFLNKDKGFKIYKSAYITEANSASLDYLFKVERKSRKDKDEATIYMVMQKDGSNIKSSMTADDVDRAKAFLTNLRPNVEAANLELQIKAQEEVVAKAEKKLSSLKTDQVDLEKKIAKNKEDQLNTEKDIITQKTSLDTLRSKRIPN